MLRVFLPGALRDDRADAWVRYAADGRVIDRGTDVPARWPADADTEVVLAADQVRIIALALPPMPRDRRRAAARYALEDQLATSADESSIAVADAHDGIVQAAVTSEALVSAIRRHLRRVHRIIPESALAPHVDGWTWCASAAPGGFVRRADGSTFATGGPPAAHDALPPELTAALGQAARARAAPPVVHVAFRCDASQLAHWSQASGVPFVAAPAWHWENATLAAFQAAPDFAGDDRAHETAANRASASRAFRPATILAALALIVQLFGLVFEWSWLNVENWRLSRALVDEAAAAQLPDAATPGAAVAAIARRNAELRHRAGQSALDDPLSLLARAAPSLRVLPPATLRSARYAGHAWTLELATLEPSALSRVTRTLAAAGVEAVSAPTPAGMRMRLSLGGTAR